MNRWCGWVGEPDMLEEMRTAAPRIATYADWKREFLALAERASQQVLQSLGLPNLLALPAASTHTAVTNDTQT